METNIFEHAIKIFRETEIAERCNSSEAWISRIDGDSLETQVNDWIRSNEVVVLNTSISEQTHKEQYKLTTFRTLVITFQDQMANLDKEVHLRRLTAIAMTPSIKKWLEEIVSDRFQKRDKEEGG